MAMTFLKQFLVNVALDKGKLTGNKIADDIEMAKKSEKKKSVFDMAESQDKPQDSGWTATKKKEDDEKK